ncbi:sugar phosphate nucleotidyltransferase [Helicobacter sp.]|uniref:sugar phosphate nucleotidyltransferase n=1 Tax=Helicobacter sp. TaxID=218 RepID=UPI00375154D2|nr:sugar phosphate nucleotidyltransferase [Helicobacter sp.]
MNNVCPDVIILAGGLGTRLRGHISEAIPKPMAPIGDVPFLHILLTKCAREGFKRVILSVGYKQEAIMQYFGDHFLGLEILYAQEKHPLGTGGAIQFALEFVKSPYVLLLNGDTFFDINFWDFMTYHHKTSLLKIALTPLLNTRYGSITLDSQGFITNFMVASDSTHSLINAGVYSMSQQIFKNFNLPEAFSFEAFIMEHYKEILASGEVYEAKFIDIGIPQDYLRAQNYLQTP